MSIKKLEELEERLKDKKVLKFMLGILFILIGVVGGFIPIIQGWIFVLIGSYLLFGERFKRVIKKLKKKDSK